ncbi:MAG: hypothetical protein FJ009_14600 [Chloroflexi bacterium]|nr:hypothetical protein [Chloroflexota bacterium]
MGCVTCHNGNGATSDQAAAHKNIIAEPSKHPEKACSFCHDKQVQHAATSLHVNQNGYWTYLKAVGADVNSPVLKEAFNNHCAECHSTCGQCHISRPAFTGGGFLAGHTASKKASVKETCTACHGARVGDEFFGNYDFIPGDVHASKLQMTCMTCHKSASAHGDGQLRATMWDKPTVTCESCHKDTMSNARITQHTLHKDKLSCQVCHSVAYKNCANCHTGKDAKGLPFRTLDPSWLDFKIGKNPNKTAERPYNYTVVRHVPTNADLFKGYGITFPNPDAVPSWRMTTPHNIQRKTAQNASCDACHGNAKIFLTVDAAKATERNANKNVIVDKVPAKTGQ